MSTNVLDLTPTASVAASANKNGANFSIVVQVPTPFFNTNDLIGKFILPALGLPNIPKAIAWLNLNAVKVLQNTINVATKLIRAIPEASVQILVKVGPVAVLNIKLIADKVPTVVPLPVFRLDLPNLAVGLNLTLPVPTLPPIIMKVPIPIPIIQNPLVVTGGKISVDSSVTPTPLPIANPIRLPQI